MRSHTAHMSQEDARVSPPPVIVVAAASSSRSGNERTRTRLIDPRRAPSCRHHSHCDPDCKLFEKQKRAERIVRWLIELRRGARVSSAEVIVIPCYNELFE